MDINHNEIDVYKHIFILVKGAVHLMETEHIM